MQFIPEQYIVSVVSILCREPGDIECSEQSVGPVDIEIIIPSTHSSLYSYPMNDDCDSGCDFA